MKKGAFEQERPEQWLVVLASLAQKHLSLRKNSIGLEK